MKKFYTLTLLTIFSTVIILAQDTFSIVAVDTTTGEVGSAGASCVDLDAFNLEEDDFLGQLIPNIGAINTQAYYIPANQTNATSRMYMGETPAEIIAWLVDNDVQSRPDLRQYGIVGFVEGSPESAAHTGTSTDDYKGHIVGPNYAIQGNILLGKAVLDSMEARFLRETGDLACKLMAALQGANIVGADSRCSDNGTSSLFAYVKVSQPTDEFGSPSFLASVRTSDGAEIEPIDSLQKKFDAVHNCSTSEVIELKDINSYFSIYPNPVAYDLNVLSKQGGTYDLSILDMQGRSVHRETLLNSTTIDISGLTSGTYFVNLRNEDQEFIQKIIVN